MSADIINLNTMAARLAVPAGEVLDGALEAGLSEVFILGRRADGRLFVASSTPNTGELLVLIEEWRHKLFAGDYEL